MSKGTRISKKTSAKLSRRFYEYRLVVREWTPMLQWVVDTNQTIVELGRAMGRALEPVAELLTIFAREYDKAKREASDGQANSGMIP